MLLVKCIRCRRELRCKSQISSTVLSAISWNHLREHITAVESLFLRVVWETVRTYVTLLYCFWNNLIKNFVHKNRIGIWMNDMISTRTRSDRTSLASTTSTTDHTHKQDSQSVINIVLLLLRLLVCARCRHPVALIRTSGLLQQLLSLGARRCAGHW